MYFFLLENAYILQDANDRTRFSVRMEYRILGQFERIFVPNLHFFREDGTCAFLVHAGNAKGVRPGEYSAECHVQANFLNDGLYSVRVGSASFDNGVFAHFYDRGLLTFSVRDPIDGVVTRAGYAGPIVGSVRPFMPWTLKPIN